MIFGPRKMNAFTPRRVVMMMEHAWPGLYMSAKLARDGLLSAVIVQQESLDDARWSIRGLRRAAATAGWRPAVSAFLGFRHGIHHALSRMWERTDHPQLSDLRDLKVDVYRVAAFKSEACRDLLTRLAPDVTVICGTPILPESLLSVARICTLMVSPSSISTGRLRTARRGTIGAGSWAMPRWTSFGRSCCI